MRKLITFSIFVFSILFSYSTIAQQMRVLRGSYLVKYPGKIMKSTGDPISAGTYTIGTAGDFPNIDSAFDKLSTDGIAGPVTLEFIDTLYTAPTTQTGFFINGPIPGADKDNRVTIKPATNKNVTIKGRGESVLRFLNTSYLTLDGVSLNGNTTLTIHAFDNSQYNYNDCIEFSDNSDHNIIQKISCICENLWNGSGIAFYNPTGSTSTADSNLIQYNLIKEAAMGIFLWSPDYQHNDIGNTIKWNTVGSETDSLIGWGILTGRSKNTIIEKNVVNNLKISIPDVGYNYSTVGIYSFVDINNIIRDNVVFKIKSSSGFTSTGIYLDAISSEYGNGNAVYNNMVYDIQSNSTASDNRIAGIQTWFQNNPKIYYNSVYLSGTGASHSGSAALYIYSQCTNVLAENNIFINTRDESPYCASSIYNYTTSNLISDYNDLYYESNQNNCLVRISRTKYNNLIDWQTKGEDLHSVTEMPNFIAPYLHIDESIPTNLEKRGLVIADIETDFDGDLRDANLPDIGADEFNGKITYAQDGWIQQTGWTTSNLADVFFIDNNTGTAAGHQGAILHTTNGGETWTTQSSGTNKQLLSVSFVDADIETVVGESGIMLQTTNGGETWTIKPYLTSNHLECVHFINTTFGTTVGDGGAIFHTTNGGETWEAQTSGTTNNLYNIFLIDTLLGMTVGANGTILRTTNGGNTWIPQSSGTTSDLYCAFFTNPDTGTVVGNDGTILRTTNGGEVWTAQTSNTTSDLISASFTNANTGTAVGDHGVILRTTDGGETWSIQPSNTNGLLVSVCFTDSITGTIVGFNGVILRTTTGGVTDVEEDYEKESPSKYILDQNYPNPFNPTTTIKYSIPKQSYVMLKMFDILGREVATLVNEEKPAGTYEVSWEAKNLASGVYFYKITAGAYTAVKKMVLLK